jgi:U3 small nucleolar RNA-associated protein 10
MVPYTSFLLPAFEVHLKSLPNAVDEEPSALWISLITTLTKSLSNDDGGMSALSSLIFNTQCLVSGFWRDDKLRQITIPLIQQVPLCTNFPEELDAKTAFRVCLEALVEDASDDVLLKNINLGVLLHTRSENTKVRQFALVCAESLWRIHGGKLFGTSVVLCG